MNEAVIEARNIKKYFPVRGGFLRRRSGVVRAVDGLEFSVLAAQTLSLVGESGCGKTTTARVVLGIEPPTHGTVLFRGQSIYGPSGRVLPAYRRAINAVFQDPWSSLDPRMRVFDVVAEPMRVNSDASAQDVRERVTAVLGEVGLRANDARRYPHEFSGGQRQRIALARALALNPQVIVLDEPVSALDVSIRSQIMNLLKDVQEQHGLSYLMISHNLATVRYLSDVMAVMYLGRIVEIGPSETLFDDPCHPYTQALLVAALPGHPRYRRDLARLQGEVPSPLAPPSGCAFHPRCPKAMPECSRVTPELVEISPGRKVACHLYPGSDGELMASQTSPPQV